MENPLVSILMVTYNHERFIARAIEGATQQETDFPFELVIGEDCSTDRTREIVSEYAERYPDVIRVITSDSNVGMRQNSIRTRRACRGKYISTCDGDDYWHNPTKLQKQADYLEDNPNCGLVFSDYNRYYLKTGKTVHNFFRSTNNIPPKNFNVFKRWGDSRTFCSMTPCTVMARTNLMTEILESDPYNRDDYCAGGDIAYSEIALISDVHYIDESFATYTVQIESACRSRDPKKLVKFNLSAAGAYLDIAKKHKQIDDMPAVTKNWVAACLRCAFWLYNPNLARKTLPHKNSFRKIDWLLYYGAVNRIANSVLRPVVSLNLLLRSYTQR